MEAINNAWNYCVQKLSFSLKNEPIQSSSDIILNVRNKHEYILEKQTQYFFKQLKCYPLCEGFDIYKKNFQIFEKESKFLVWHLIQMMKNKIRSIEHRSCSLIQRSIIKIEKKEKH